MREALNDNPVVQIAVIGVLVVAAAVMVMTTMGGGGSKPAEEQSSAAVTPSPAAPSPTTPGAESAQTPSAQTPSAQTPSAQTPAPSAAAPSAEPSTVSPLVAGPGLPQRVVLDYSQGNTIVLLIVRPGGIDDGLVRKATSQLSGRSEVSLFVAPANKIARYSRITAGVGVSQVPALVVVSPRSVSGDAPKATVSYGFRSGDSVAQAVRDAEYKGPSVGYDPG